MPTKRSHEIRDPIHTFIKVDNRERDVINSRPFQRLRHIHQLALAYLLYPGATHRRFEHSLGVMELAGQVFDVVTNPENIRFSSVRDMMPDAVDMLYWRRVMRAAACGYSKCVWSPVEIAT
jgi:HD superfamily phosphohydrolase